MLLLLLLLLVAVLPFVVVFFYLSCFEWSMKDFLAVNCPLTNQYELNLNMNRNVNET